MINAPFALAFTAGMIATVNPCGFAMLPAYLGYFLGVESGDDIDTGTGLWRALLVAAAVSAGFLVLFAIAGAIVSWTSFSVGRFSPWLTVVIGVVLVGVGIGFLRGWEPKVRLPQLGRGGKSRGLGSMFVFGISYAIASLSCTLGPFTSVVASTFSRRSPAAGVATFVAYGLGMGLLLAALTVALALARQGFVGGLRRALPYVQRVSGAVMVAMGAYLVWYGIYEIRLLEQGKAGAAGPVDTVTRWSGDISNRLSNVDSTQVALVLALVVLAATIVILLRGGRRPGAVSGD